VDQLGHSILVNLLTQAVDVHFNQVCLAIKMAIPNVFYYFTAGNKFGSVKQEKLQECEFFDGQGNGLLAPGGASPMTVEDKICIAELGVPAMKTSSNQRPDAREKFCQDKGLGEIVISAGIQAFDPLLDQVSSREHQDRSFYPSLAQLAADLDSAKTGQSDIEEDGVVRDIGTQFERFLTRFGHIHGIRVFPQRTRDEVSHLPFVFH
jgi:hypothetical protein